MSPRFLDTKLLRWQKRATEKGVPFNLTTTDIHWPALCPVLGIALDYSPGVVGTEQSDFAPSLDRIIPAKGYVRGNVLVISSRANRWKSDCTDAAALRKIADYVEIFSA